MSATDDKIKGSVNQASGKMTGDHKKEAKGKVQEITGNIKDKAEEVKDNVGEAVSGAIDSVKDKIGKDK